MNIIPFNLNKIAFKGAPIVSENKSDTNSDVKNTNSTTLSSNPVAAAQIGIKTPVPYKRIAYIPIPECKEPGQLYKLSTGQKVLILPKEGPVVVKTSFNVGSMNEPDNLRGISHYIEHNLFNGTEKLGPGEFFQKVSDLGGYTNAATGYNQTNYYVKSQLLNSDYLKNIIELHADQVQNPKFAQDQLTKEKGPVTSEISMYADKPFNIGRNIALKNLYQINSTSQDMIAGNIQNINSITREDVVNYYNTWYTPDNSVTVVTGDVKPEEAIDLIAKNFTKTNQSQSQNKKYETLIPRENPVRVDINKSNFPGTIINMGFVGPENTNTKDKVAMEVLSVMLTGYTNARLTKALEPLLCEAEFSMEKVGGKNDDKQAIFIAAATPKEKCEEALKIIYKEIAKLSQNPPSKEEIQIAVNKLKMSLSEGNESSISLNEFISSALLDNDFNYLTNYKNILDSLTPQDIQNAVKKYLDLNKTSISVMHPHTSSSETILDNYKKANSTKPAQIAFGSSSAKSTDFHSKVKEYHLQNNIEVAINPVESDFSAYHLSLNLPKYLDVSEPELLILEQMLNRGSAFRDKQSFNEELEKSNIEIGFGVCPTGLYATGKTINQNVEQALGMTKEVLLNPRFTNEDFNIAKQRTKELLEGSQKSAEDKLNPALNPYLKFMAGKTEALKSLESVSLDKIQTLYQTILANASGQAILSAPTEKNPQIADKFMNSLSVGIPTLKQFESKPVNTYMPNETEKILTETEQRCQAEIIRAYKFKTSGNIEDQAKLKVLNMVLGGNSSSRLFTDLREDQKLAYYVASKVETFGDTSTIKLNILTTTDDPNDPNNTPENINKSLAGFDKHINKLKTEQVTQKELDKAKLILKNNILNSLETSIDKTIALADSKSTPYGIDKTKKLLEAIEKVTAQDVKNAAVYAFNSQPITSILASEKSLKEAGIKEI